MKWRWPSLAWCLFFVAVAVRVVFLGAVPSSIENEEARLGYAAWSWLHFGAKAAFFPDPLSGEPTPGLLYVALSLPFVAAFGPSAAAVRIVAAVAGIASLSMFAGLANREGPSWRNLALLVVVTSPWHLMASRWASGAHLAPALVLAAVLLFDEGRAGAARFVSATLLLSASALASGPALVFAVVFFALAFGSALRARAPGGVLAASLALSPPVLVSLLVMGSGVVSLRSLFGGADLLLTTPAGLTRIPDNAGRVVTRLLGAFPDGTAFDAPGWGPFLLLLVPFLVRGIQLAQNEPRPTDRTMLVWFASALATACVYRADLRSMSLVFIPALWLAARGLSSFAEHRAVFVSLRGLVAVAGAWFSVAYFSSTTGRDYPGPWVGFGETLQRALSVAPANAAIVVTARTPNAYVPTLFYAKVPPGRFATTARTSMIPILPPPSTGFPTSFRDVSEFDRFSFRAGPPDFAGVGGRPPYWIAERSEWAQVDAPLFSLESFGRYAVVSLRSPEQQACFTPIEASRLQGAQDAGVLTVDGTVAGAAGAGFTIAGQRYNTGLGVHGESAYTLTVTGDWDLTFGIAMSDASVCGDGVTFEVLVDDRSVFTSSRHRVGDVEFRAFHVSPRRSLKFVTHAGANSYCDHANWLRPALIGCL